MQKRRHRMIPSVLSQAQTKHVYDDEIPMVVTFGQRGSEEGVVKEPAGGLKCTAT
jgi:hypothetical protein